MKTTRAHGVFNAEELEADLNVANLNLQSSEPVKKELNPINEAKQPRRQVKEPYSTSLFINNPNPKTRNYIQGSRRMTGGQIFQLVKIFNYSIQASVDDDLFRNDYYFLKYKEAVERNQFENKSESINGNQNQASKISLNQVFEDLKLLREKGLSNFIASRSDEYETTAAIKKNSKRFDLKDIAKRKVEYSKKYKEVVDNWKSDHQVLGRLTKSNILTPKPLLQVPTASTMTDNNLTSSSIQNNPIWKIRKVINDIYYLVSEVNDLHIEIHSALSSFSPTAENTIYASASMVDSETINNLEQQSKSKVLDLEKKQILLCDKLAVMIGMSSITDDNIALNLSYLKSIIWFMKGRKVLLKLFDVLLPPHHELLMYSIYENVQFFVCRLGDEHLAMNVKTANEICSQLEKMILSEINKCLSKMLKVLTPEKLKFIIDTPGGSRIIPKLLLHGQQLCEDKSDINVTERTRIKWEKNVEKFLSMAQAGLQLE